MEPLTWSELKQLVGKPVWIKKTYLKKGKWVVIWFFDSLKTENNIFEWFCTTDDNSFRKEQQGELWQAYKQEVLNLPTKPYIPPVIIINGK